MAEDVSLRRQRGSSGDGGPIGPAGGARLIENKLAESVDPTCSASCWQGHWPDPAVALAGSQFQRRDDPSVGSKCLEPNPVVPADRCDGLGEMVHWLCPALDLPLKSG